ncbi:hypothetical protein SFA35_10655 [Pseudomonas sp. HR96]|uniref:Dyp-type peroxidase n=1 Tax=Pseudomonas sp. HR96 TaxID=1027966 RepID=UPI002A74F839|nr:hypothetical protein [Pseudomonas sp. HR96]WPP01773.1 hypothetical protein SFA35_10655 [Pseudomonas sp. HR96]
MTVTLTNSIAWKDASGDDLAMLENLQPNILKEHARDHSTLLFLQFASASAGRSFLSAIAAHLKSTLTHLQEINAYKCGRGSGTPYVGVGLTAAGYAALQVTAVPADPSFAAGMQATTGLNDPHPDTWDGYFHDPKALHGLVIIGDAKSDPMAHKLAQIHHLIAAHPGVNILGTQEGRAMHNSNGDGIEHFGYVDGRSQPLFLHEDLEAERLLKDGTSTWNPDFPLQQAIVSDPAAPDPSRHFGSYFIFRKLEQNVKRFKEQELAFADSLKLAGVDRERAGAMVLGRFEDGTPVTSQFADGNHHPVPNNFNYGSDAEGAKCPFLGHIRKTNPRGSGGFGQTAEQERAHLMARRGLTYGKRLDNPNDGKTDNKPEQDVGLLFMAFNSNIGDQFEFTQINWANNPDFPQLPADSPAGTHAPGIDPVIGQLPVGQGRRDVSSPAAWGKPGEIISVPSVPQAVTMKGGEYFFMPSLAFFTNLKAA